MTRQTKLVLVHWRTILDITASVVMIFAGTALIAALLLARSANRVLRADVTSVLPTDPLSLDGAAVRGSATARVALVEYADYERPFCAEFALQVLPAIEQQYIRTGKVKFAFRHLPLTSIHPFALRAALGAECSRQQGKFWEMHDLLFKNSASLNEGALARFADGIGLDVAAFAKCVDGDGSAAIAEHVKSARSLGLTGTPAFFIGLVQEDGRVKVTARVTGVREDASFSREFDRLLPASGTRRGLQ